MKHAEGAAKELDEALARIERDKVVGLRLDDLRDLMVEPDPDPFEIRRSPYRAGVEDIVPTLRGPRRLRAELTVRFALRGDRAPPSPVGTAQAALRSRAADL